MTAEIDRIGLLSAGVTVASVIAALGGIFGLLMIVAAGVSGDAGWLPELAQSGAADPQEADRSAGLLAAISLALLLAVCLGLWVLGFAIGAFLAALYNVLAGLVGGIRIELKDPRPKEPRRRS